MKGGFVLNTQLKKGSLELCVLAVLSRKDCYGYELVSLISKNILITEGTIYPLLKRLKDDGLLTTYLVEESDGPARKYYKITDTGLEIKEKMQTEWTEFAFGVNRILEGDYHDKK